MKPLLLTLALALLTNFSKAQVTLVQDINPGEQESYLTWKCVFKNKLMFYTLTTNGWLLSYYDGTTVSQVPGFLASNRSHTMAVADGSLYYCSANSSVGAELIKWDGVNSPSVAADVYSGPDHSVPLNLISFNNKVYFTTGAGMANYTIELWEYDPATNIARKLSDNTYLTVTNLAVFKNKIYFAGHDGQLYLYDPIVDAVQVAPYFDPSVKDVFGITVCYNKLYFSGTSNTYGREFYTYDENSAPVRLTDINAGSNNSVDYTIFQEDNIPLIAGFKNSVYFTASNGSRGYQLYKYDPNFAVSETNPSFVYTITPEYDILPELIVYDDRLYFQGNDGVHGVELWMYDGVHDPSMVADINTDAIDVPTRRGYSYPQHFAIYNNNLYFSAIGMTTGKELYKLAFPSNVENVKMINSIKAYPVPVVDILNFEIDLKAISVFTISLTDIIGREVFNTGIKSHDKGKARIQANLSQLPPGNYSYKIIATDGSMLASGKVVK